MLEIENKTIIFKSLPRMYQKKIEGENYAIRSLKKEEVDEVINVLNSAGGVKIKIVNSVTGDYALYNIIDVKFKPIGYALKIVCGVEIKQEYYSGVFKW